MSGEAERCFVCAARMWAPTDRSLSFPSGRHRRFRFACGACGLLADASADGAGCRTHLEMRLSGDAFVSDEDAPYGLDIYTLRTAATRFAKAVEPRDPAQQDALRFPHGGVAAAARLATLSANAEARVSLGILCRPNDLDQVLARLPDDAAWTDDVVVMVDAADVPPPPAAGLRIVARGLAGDFAAQRNALQALGRHAWMLQLDADETIARNEAARLPALAGMARRDGAVSIGLPRRNLVDGVLSDVFPDVQYRLNRREVRFAGRVHERPERPWQQSFIALHGAIDHHLERAHVASRSRRYEAMEPGRGRLGEADALLVPYRA